MSMPNPEPIFVDDALLRQAEQLCKLRLTNDPDNRSLLSSLGKVYRKQGKLDDARAIYERLTRLDPEDRESAYMHAVLAGIDVPAPPPGIHPAPFVLLKNFLPSALHETLVPFVLANQDKLVPAKVGNNEYKPECRESLEIPGKWDAQKAIHEHVREIIPRVLAPLDVAPFEIGKLEVKLRVYLDGHFFRIHMDCPANSEDNANRKVSYVYFFHKLPRAYTGGGLLLFDTDVENNKYTTAGFTRIEPEDNSIVLFSSAYYHSVVPVSCPSKEVANSRFVINGHVSKPVAVKPAVEAPAIDVLAQVAPAETGMVAAPV
jgi:Rps23 Pro-64 3,4-dihydroxylase Tpa1-like proline 4-hydroxylase